jgi:hypothetical protein
MEQYSGVNVVCTTKARHFCSVEHTEFCVHGAGIVNNLEARYKRRASGCVVTQHFVSVSAAGERSQTANTNHVRNTSLSASK